MSLRLLEVIVPDQPLEGVLVLLQDVNVVQVWTAGPPEAPGLVRILLDARGRAVIRPPRAPLRFAEGLPPDSPSGGGDTARRREAVRGGGHGRAQEDQPGGTLRASRAGQSADRGIRGHGGALDGGGGGRAAPRRRGHHHRRNGHRTAPGTERCTVAGLHPGRPGAGQAIAAGVATAAALSLLLGAVLGVDPSAPEIVARTRVDGGDIALALAAGTAGSLAFTSGVPAVVVGVMVAVALLPPLVASGLLAGAGFWIAAVGALMLTLTNVTCINLAAVATFLVQQVRPRTWWEAKRAKRATRLAVTAWVVMLAALAALMLSDYVGAG